METEKEDFATWFARRKHLFKGNLDFVSSIVTPQKMPGFVDWGKNMPEDKKAALSQGLLSEEFKTDVSKFKEELRNVQRAEKLEHTQNTPEGQNTPPQGTPQTTPGSKGASRQTKLPRGKKEPYVKQDEINKLLQGILNRYKTATLSKKANAAISEMETRGKMFVDNKGKSVYKKSTIKKMLSELNNTKKTKGKS